MKNLSIITDFGCPFSCYFCISKSQKTKKDFVFDIDTFSNMERTFDLSAYDRISLSGGGDPLFIHSEEINKFYIGLFEFSKKHNLPLHMHTNFRDPADICHDFDKIVLSIHEEDYIYKLNKWSEFKNLRVAFVSTGDNDIELLKRVYAAVPESIQFTVKQLDYVDISCFSEVKKFLSTKKNARFLPNGDYNEYFYLNDQEVFYNFRDIVFK